MKNNKAQALVEYVLIIALMSILIISLIKFFGGYIKDAITKASCNIGGYEYIEGKKVGDGTCKSKDSDILFPEDDDEDEDTKEKDKNVKEDD